MMRRALMHASRFTTTNLIFEHVCKMKRHRPSLGRIMAGRLTAAGVLCSVVAILLYVNTLDCGICFDDEPAIKKNQDLRPHSPWTDLFYHDFWGAQMDSPTSHKSYRPLCVATYKLNYLVHELQPMGYHLVNVLLHSAVCYLYVQLCGLVFREVWPALITGLLFAVHPIHTEAVAGLVGRAESLSGVFFLGAFFCYRVAAESNGLKWLFLSLLLCLCSALSKEQGITVVAVCLAYDFFILQNMDLPSSFKLLEVIRTEPWNIPKPFKQFLKRAFLLAIFTVAFMVMRISIMHGGPNLFNKSINPPLFLDTPYRQLNWMYLIFVNCWLLLNPFQLCADWRFGAIPLITSFSDPRNLLTVVVFTSVVALGYFGISRSGKNQKVVVFGFLLTVVSYLPASNLLFPVGFVVAERVLYLPSMGFCILIGYGSWCIIQKLNYRFLKALVGIVILALLAVHSVKTVLRNQDWQSNFAIYSAGVKCNPNNGVMLSNLGIEYAHMKNYTFAEELYRTATIVAPNHSRGWANLGGLMEGLKRYGEAEVAIRKAIEVGAEDNTAAKLVETYAFLIENVIMRDDSRIQEALELCESALSQYTTYAQLYSVKGGILLKLNRTREAIENLELSMKSGLRLADTRYYLGQAYTKVGDKAKAENMFRSALSIDPNHKDAMHQLGILLHSIGGVTRLMEAEKVLLRVVSTSSRNKQAIFDLALVYYDLKNYPKADEWFQKFLHRSPQHKDTLYTLGVLYIKQRKHDDAVEMFRRLQKIDPNYRDTTKLLKSIGTHSQS